MGFESDDKRRRFRRILMRITGNMFTSAHRSNDTIFTSGLVLENMMQAATVFHHEALGTFPLL